MFLKMGNHKPCGIATNRVAPRIPLEGEPELREVNLVATRPGSACTGKSAAVMPREQLLHACSDYAARAGRVQGDSGRNLGGQVWVQV